MKLRIAFIDEDMSLRTGSRRFTCEVANQLLGMGHEVRIFTLGMDKKTCFSKCLSLPVDVTAAYGSPFQVGSSSGLRKALRNFGNKPMVNIVKDLNYDLRATRFALNVSHKIVREKFDAAVFHYHGGHWLFPFFYHMKETKNAIYLNMVPPRPPPHALPFQEPSLERRVADGLFSMPLIRMFENESLRNVSQFITPSEYQRQQALMQGVVGKKEAVVVPLGVDHSEFYPAGEEEPFVLYLGRIHPHKSVELAIEAMKNSKPDFSFVIAGEVDSTTVGYMKKLLSLAESLNLADRIRVVLHPSEEQIRDLMQRCSVFLFPGTIDTFGLVVLEAMACGKPVVACRRGGVPEIVGDAGFLLEPDAQDWNRVVTSLLSDSKSRHSMGSKALERSRLFSWENTTKRLLKAFHHESD